MEAEYSFHLTEISGKISCPSGHILAEHFFAIGTLRGEFPIKTNQQKYSKKPGYVVGDHLSGASVAEGSSDLPESTTGRRIAFCSVLLRMGLHVPGLLPGRR